MSNSQKTIHLEWNISSEFHLYRNLIAQKSLSFTITKKSPVNDCPAADLSVQILKYVVM